MRQLRISFGDVKRTFNIALRIRKRWHGRTQPLIHRSVQSVAVVVEKDCCSTVARSKQSVEIAMSEEDSSTP